ncbi:MAG: ferrous iron transport protein A [Verrucomicrobia bacterium]|jgi:Fe2+ transport system protein FeoA|nr:MAG: ferrous iron transport protein A [Verrucomicrobiota bacterium]MDH4469617.1 ferrous iron transport protein A [Verrucomicrobiae bacterium]
MNLSLCALQPNEEAVVLELPKEERIANRLREMGLLPGTTIVFVRRAPLGDPLEIRLRGYSLSLRQNEAASILVKKREA